MSATRSKDECWCMCEAKTVYVIRQTLPHPQQLSDRFICPLISSSRDIAPALHILADNQPLCSQATVSSNSQSVQLTPCRANKEVPRIPSRFSTTFLSLIRRYDDQILTTHSHHHRHNILWERLPSLACFPQSATKLIMKWLTKSVAAFQIPSLEQP